MKKTIFILSALLLTYTGCKKAVNCDSSVYTGESVRIPITFIGFFPQEINNIQVYRTNPAFPGKVDTFPLSKILWAYSAHSDNESITDRPLDGNTEPTYSYLNNCTLVFHWPSNTGLKNDTLSNFKISKSKVTTEDKCHENDPIIKVDAVSYTFRGKTILRDSSITIHKD